MRRPLEPTLKQVDVMVEQPPHYRAGTVYEAIRVIEAWGRGFHLGNAVKYICRADFKDNRLQNLQKARWYIDREIRNLEAAERKALVEEAVRGNVGRKKGSR